MATIIGVVYPVKKQPKKVTKAQADKVTGDDEKAPKTAEKADSEEG